MMAPLSNVKASRHIAGSSLRAGFTAVLTAILTCLTSASLAQNPRQLPDRTPGPLYGDAIKLGDTAARALLDASSIPGLSVAVGVDGAIVWSEGFGYADLENEAPVKRETRFRLGSVSKMLTVAALARLHQEGKIDLDTPIQRYVPTFPDKGYPITARQLAGHLGGVRHYQLKDSSGRNIDREHYDTVLDSLKIFQDDPLVAPPGTKYSYSTFGYTLLSRVIEAAAGRDFLDYLRDHVTEPLGMKRTTPDRPIDIIPDRSRFYDRGGDGTIANAAFVDSSYKWAGGGMLSTAEDLVRFGFAHQRAGFFKIETLDLLFSPQRTADGKETGVGIGWRITTDPRGRRIVHHAGNIAGGRALILIYRDEGLVVAMLSNLGQTPANVERAALTLAEPFLDARNGARSASAAMAPTGSFDYVIEGKGQQYSGTIGIGAGGSNLEGWMTTSQPLKAIADITGPAAVERVRITNIQAAEQEVRGVIATRYGLYPMRLELNGNEATGEIRVRIDSPTPDLIFRATKRRR